MNGHVDIDYKNESTLIALSQVLLREYFQLNVEFAPGSLIPTIPQRLNYILWLEDLLKLAGNVDNIIGSKPIRGIDIGKFLSYQIYLLQVSGEETLVERLI